MPRASTLTAAFAYFGATVRNPRWSWSAVTPDEQTVILTMWEDRIMPDGSVDFFDGPHAAHWQKQIGNRFRIKDLQTARANCDGQFRIVRVTAADVDARPRKIVARSPDPDVIMKVTKLDPSTGEFAAIRVR